MSTTKATKPISRESIATRFERSKRRPIIVTIFPHGEIGFRLKGTRSTFTLSIEGCYDLAVKAHLRQAAKNKLKTRD